MKVHEYLEKPFEVLLQQVINISSNFLDKKNELCTLSHWFVDLLKPVANIIASKGCSFPFSNTTSLPLMFVIPGSTCLYITNNLSIIAIFFLHSIRFIITSVKILK